MQNINSTTIHEEYCNQKLLGYNIIKNIILYLQNNQDIANHKESHTETCHTDSGWGYSDCSHGK